MEVDEKTVDLVFREKKKLDCLSEELDSQDKIHLPGRRKRKKARVTLKVNVKVHFQFFVLAEYN